MSRPIWSLNRCLLLAFAFLAMLQIESFCLLVLLQITLFEVPDSAGLIFSQSCFVTAFLAAIFGASFGWRHRWLWRLCRHVRRFATVENARIVLHYEPELESAEISAFLRSYEEELDKLTLRFGSPLRGRVTVYLLSHWRDISAIYGPGYSGFAIFAAKAVVIANDNGVPELLRHELAHLFSFRWSRFAPALLSEGLSVWLQETNGGQPIDSVALPLLQQGGPNLASLLRSKSFHAEARRQCCYIMAGSFTGFLIRRYGWKRYRKLYYLCDGIRFRAKFQKCFDVSLETAERQWRSELLAMQS